MFLSVFDIFKIGIGPSSSHTMGPMTAASAFMRVVQTYTGALLTSRLQVSLHGSLAFTGKGHATDRAVALGLLGWLPETFDSDRALSQLEMLQECRSLGHGSNRILFDPAVDVIFDYGPPLPGHANGLRFRLLDAAGSVLLSETYYSIGGGFIQTAKEREEASEFDRDTSISWPYPFSTASEMLAMARSSGKSIGSMKRENELVVRQPEAVERGLIHIWTIMNSCIERGLKGRGELPGGLKVKRRAADIFDQLKAQSHVNSRLPFIAVDWLGAYAMAVNEENAAGGQVVTAPTNGAAGIVPAVLRYYLDHCSNNDEGLIPEYLLTAAAIGGLIKHNASISGAEAGCQGEVGSAASMAAAGLCAILGGTPEQVENAAEIALEHHLGMTCDPAAGLVQVPCIERNGIGAVKAVAAASLALRGNGSHFMPLDNCIEAMRQTGEEMSIKYKETSLGGLAVNLPEC